MSHTFLSSVSNLLFPIGEQGSRQKTRINSIYTHWVDRAVVTEVIQPGFRGRVRFQATTWFAICPYHAVLPANTPVRVVEHYNATTLVVEPVFLVTPEDSIDAA